MSWLHTWQATIGPPLRAAGVHFYGITSPPVALRSGQAAATDPAAPAGSSEFQLAAAGDSVGRSGGKRSREEHGPDESAGGGLAPRNKNGGCRDGGAAMDGEAAESVLERICVKDGGDDGGGGGRDGGGDALPVRARQRQEPLRGGMPSLGDAPAAAGGRDSWHPGRVVAGEVRQLEEAGNEVGQQRQECSRRGLVAPAEEHKDGRRGQKEQEGEGADDQEVGEEEEEEERGESDLKEDKRSGEGCTKEEVGKEEEEEARELHGGGPEEGWGVEEEARHRKECLAALQYTLCADVDSEAHGFVVFNLAPAAFESAFSAAHPGLYRRLRAALPGELGWGEVEHWMWPLFTRRWAHWREASLGLSRCPLTDPVTELPVVYRWPSATPLL
eukprot:jgi/Mesen1/4662/ME000241S03708